MGFPGGLANKESTYSAGDPGSILGSGRSPGEGNGIPVQYSYLENSMDRGAWRAAVYGGHKESDRTERLKRKKRNHILTKQRQGILGQGRDMGYTFKPGWALPNSVVFRSHSTSLDPVDSLVKLKC